MWYVTSYSLEVRYLRFGGNLIPPSRILTMEAREYKMLAPTYQITRRRFPEDRVIHIHRLSY